MFGLKWENNHYFVLCILSVCDKNDKELFRYHHRITKKSYDDTVIMNRTTRNSFLLKTVIWGYAVKNVIFALFLCQKNENVGCSHERIYKTL